MLGPRWRKVMRDLVGNKTRTVLVVLSISVGVFSIGMIGGAREIILRGLEDNYAAINAASATLIAEPFDDDLVGTVRALPEVDEAEGRRAVTVRLSTGPDTWRDLELFAVADYDDIRLNRIYPEEGAWPPLERELLLERASLAYIGWEIGRTAQIEMPDGNTFELRVAGTSHDLNQPGAVTSGRLYGHVTLDTLVWLGEPRSFNQLYFTVAEKPLDREHIQAATLRVQEEVEASGRRVFLTQVPEPGKFWAGDAVRSMLLLLGALGLGALFMSGFLVINTTSALLNQQVRQIGVMKAVGARTPQTAAMYLFMVFVLGVVAFVVSVPLGVVGAVALISDATRTLNFNTETFRLSPQVVALQAAASILLPLAAALVPIIRGSGITVREAISSQGLGGGAFGESVVDRLLKAIQGLSWPLLLSLRNTIRRKGRLAMTLITLTLASMFVISVLSVRDSFGLTHADVFRSQKWDVELTLRQPHPVEDLQREALSVPGVVRAEAWAFRAAQRMRDDGTVSSTVLLTGLPADTELFEPIVVSGRWLTPEDDSALVVRTDVLKDEPDLAVGDEIILRIDGQDRPWQVVGIAQGTLSGPVGYASYPYLADLVGETGRADRLQIVTEQHTSQFQAQVTRALEAHFKQAGYRVASTYTTAEEADLLAANFDIIVVFLLVMAMLMAVVGGLGLMGTTSMSVLERTREIGVMRAIGATDGAILSIVMTEAILIGLASWFLGLLLAIPASQALSYMVGVAFLLTPLSYTFSVEGAAIWLVLTVVLAAVASFFPAWNASRLTVCDVLAYE